MAIINPNGIEYLKQVELNEEMKRAKEDAERTKAGRNRLLVQLKEINSLRADVIDFLDTINELRCNQLYKYYEKWFKNNILNDFLKDGVGKMSESPDKLCFKSGSSTSRGAIGGYFHVNIEYFPREIKFIFYNDAFNRHYTIQLPTGNGDNDDINKFINDELPLFYDKYDSILSSIYKKLKIFLNDFKIWMNNLGKESEK